MAEAEFDQADTVYKRPIKISSTSLDYNAYFEAKQIRESLGLSEKEFVRFAIAHLILTVKQGNLKVVMSKEYIEKVVRSDAVELFDKLQRRLNQGQVEIVE